MHVANHYYGHAHVMAEYVSMPFPPMIWGYLQHGWNLHDGFAVGTNHVPGCPLFVWSEAVVRRGWSMGQRHYEVIGSAWVYLLEVDRRRREQALSSPGPTVEPLPSEPLLPEPLPSERAGTIFYPFHGWEGQQVVGDHGAMLRKLQEVEGDVPLTICLYWNEYKNPDIRAVYERAGCRVITHGLRGFAYRGTDAEFLHKQLGELRRHRRVVSNRLSSAILYGASVGCEVGVYGDPMLLMGEHAVYGGNERLRRSWPELHQEFAPTTLAREVADAELGVRHLKTAEEIMDLFRWTRPLAPAPAPVVDLVQEATR